MPSSMELARHPWRAAGLESFGWSRSFGGKAPLAAVVSSRGSKWENTEPFHGRNHEPAVLFCICCCRQDDEGRIDNFHIATVGYARDDGNRD
ncbi:hypothetical protein K438DRAFT_1813334 [Mycena galopus ATCC 62051]|nr:hypothetical protein K438DRAFT_1813334 [Mycena galopus ATCC 62051]